MKNNHIALYIDLLFCLVIMPLVIMLLPVDRWIVTNTAFLGALIAYVYILYFVFRRACLPKLFMQKKYLQILLLMTVLVAATELLTHFPMPTEYITADAHQLAAKRHMRTQTIWFFFLIVTGFSLAIELTFELFRQILSRQEMEAEKNKAELAVYKAQINPHFLFNTLNTLYGMVVLKSEQTETAFIQFINLMKYMYTNPTKEMIPIEEEVEYIREFIEIQKYRTEKKELIHFSYTNDGAYPGLQIVPMLLITFIENALKYGLSSVHDDPVDIRIEVRNGILNFSTDNRKASEPHNRPKGIGIANCRKRLELAYPERHTLEIKETEHEFKVLLTIKLIEP